MNEFLNSNTMDKLDKVLEGLPVPKPKPVEPQKDKGPPPPYPFKFVSREEWGALPASENLPDINMPVPYYTYTFTSTDPCNTREDCVKRVQELQKTHMLAKGLPDIAYNFIIGGDQTVYEGRGWFKKPIRLDDKLKEYKGKCIDVAYMGYLGGGIKRNFYCVEILELRDELIRYGMEQEYLDEYALWDRIDMYAEGFEVDDDPKMPNIRNKYA